MFDKFRQAEEQYKELQKTRAESSDEASKVHLKEIIQRKFTTTIIGSLDSVEKVFGYLWAKGISPDELTEKEEKFRQLWLELRQEILDKGHNQSRACLHEVDNYKVHLQKKQFYFPIEERA